MTSIDTRSPAVTPTPSSEYLTAQEVAVITHVSYRTVLRWTADGLPSYRPRRGMLRIRRRDLDAFLEKHRVGGAP